ncbi:methylase [Rhodococcus ruber Chol-4]|uniref:peptide chain release factor N(5)-glutamine methyltransferase n=1 Tax=Rhodococcus ruber TaxID=1830 RepID=A0A098BFN6_9NOCA|nr:MULTISPECIES: putative protein N(5)-glutamine methyltransferase [Rhodococcus]AUM18918.1 putative protein N(5)-glutamine methyltransferase [Rhodococcus ruber]KXF85544.1 methylase [Rhodococcus ruber Chol-4]MBD8053971.1 putative protein N(5)-glutamine methyltransferase [Rhodococcus ruber]MBP2213920.1 release factor glutamine methyltransferase [Rhodococcus ruber]MCD2125052.1 putative protein N(5)-glutamine methyltransferase [Rhodococcus ruber]
MPPPPDVTAVAATLRRAGCVFAEDEARLLIDAARTPGDLADSVRRRAAGEPLEHVLGWTEFRGLRIHVTPGVFVPRRRSEFLVECAVALAAPGVVVDLCCGSGALGAAVAAAVADVELHATDLDPAAVECAGRNLAAFGGHVYEGDLYDPLPAGLRGRVHLLLANVPYVPTADLALLPADAREHEARIALDGGADGLDVLRRVAAAAGRWLAPGGHLLVESSTQQADGIAACFDRNGLTPQVAHSDDDFATVVVGTAPR